MYKPLALLILLILSPLLVLCQSATIRGIVLDGQTSQPLPFASVYINYSTIGTNSNEKGEFLLGNLRPGEYDLIASFVGHQPHQSHVVLTDSSTLVLTIRLNVIALKEVQVRAKIDSQWEKQLEKFNKLFLGQGPDAKHCKILNPWSLSFEETSKGFFIARASEVLEIENMSLGYKISYELKNFSVSKDNYMLSGFVRFRELETMDTVLTAQWHKKRNEDYWGSATHLFRSIVNQRAEQEGYRLYEDRSGLGRIVRTEKFNANLDKTIFNYSVAGKVSPGRIEGTYQVQLPSRLEVHSRRKITPARVYSDIPYPVSWIEVAGGFLTVTKDGIVLNPLRMTISGNMFESRIADILPNDFRPELRVAEFQNPVESKPLSSLTYLLEKPYLQTDRSYYYANEEIWFKAYMSYFSPLLKDSLSHVLYIDLANENGESVSTRRFVINKGVASGSIPVPASIKKGDYTLRAYTRWMLNFDPELIFKRPLKILAPDELARATEARAPVSEEMTISSEKEQYNFREKISLSIDMKNEFDQRPAANISVSVTDMAQVVPVPDEPNILTAFRLPQITVPDTLDTKNRYMIQNGFDISGVFVPQKGKVLQGLITLVQEEANLEFVVMTEEDGRLFMPNLLLYDSAKLSYVAKTIKGKAGGVRFDSAQVLSAIGVAKPLQLEIYKTDKMVPRQLPDFSDQTFLLEEVTVKATPIESKSQSNLMADYTITGDWIRSRNSTDILGSLQTRIPGLRVFIISENGFPRKMIMIGGPSSFGGAKIQEPLVLIDNYAVNDMPGGAAAQIEMLTPGEIEAIEISKFGGNAAFGARGGNGVISIHTRRKDPETTTGVGAYDKSMLKPLKTHGFSTSRKFTAPDYSKPSKYDHVPDTRSTIYWNPSLSLNGKNATEITSFAADMPTKYRVVVEGVTTDGIPIRAEKIISIGQAP